MHLGLSHEEEVNGTKRIGIGDEGLSVVGQQHPRTHPEECGNSPPEVPVKVVSMAAEENHLGSPTATLQGNSMFLSWSDGNCQLLLGYLVTFYF